MDQRPDQLKEPDWLEDRRTAPPRVDDGAMSTDAIDYHHRETERIKADIEGTRAEMGQTINEIQERLSPEHIIDQVKETVREATIGKVERAMDKVGEKISDVTEPALDAMGRAGEALKETGSSVANTIRQNPIPCALIGLGVGMFVVNRIRNADGRTMRSKMYQESKQVDSGMDTQEYAGSQQYTGSTRNALKQVKETAGDLANGTAEKVSHLGEQAKEGAIWAGRGFQRVVRQNPLAVGAAAIAVGAAVGLALPTTRVEHEYMGEASEKLVDKAQQVARDAMEKVKEVTQGDTSGQASRPQPRQSSM